MNSVLIVDDHPIVRQGIAQLLTRENTFGPIFEAGTAREAMAQLARHRPELMIVDLMLGHDYGLDLIRQIRRGDSCVRILVISMHDERLYAERCIRAGANGFLMKHVATEQLLSAARRVLCGDTVLSPAMQTQLLPVGQDYRPSVGQGEAALNERELEVLRHIADGMSSQMIAERMSRSLKTIEAYRASMRAKLGLRGTSDLIRYASNWMLSRPRDDSGPAG